MTNNAMVKKEKGQEKFEDTINKEIIRSRKS